MEKLAILAEERRSRISSFISSITSYGLNAVKGLFFLNGSSALAALTKVSNFSIGIKAIIICSALGASFAVISSLFFFMEQRYNLDAFTIVSNKSIANYQLNNSSVVNTETKEEKTAHVFLRWAIGFFIASLVLFAASVALFIAL